MALDRAPIKSLRDVQISLVPTRTTNSDVTMDPINLAYTDMTLPGIESAETWQISTNDPLQEVAETIVGQLGNVSQIDLNITYDMLVMIEMVAHAKSYFDIIYTYDSPDLEEIAVITAHNCRLVTPGSTSSASVNSAGQQTISFQPRGGGLFADCLSAETTARPTP